MAACALVLLVLGCGSGDGNAAPTRTARPEARPASSAKPTATPAAQRGVRLARIGNFDQPLYVTAPPGDQRRVFVVEQGGRIWVVRGGRKLAEPFLDLSSKTEAGGEQGLLSMAFAPDYATSGLLLRRLHRLGRRQPDRRVQAREPTTAPTPDPRGR